MKERLTREAEATRPHAPIHAPIDCKAEISSLESIKFVVDKDFDLKPEVKVDLDPRMQVGIATLAIRPPPSKASFGSGEPAAAAPGPSNWSQIWPRSSTTWPRCTRTKSKETETTG